ncbi:uncharacterized protein LOC141874742 [Acropora palmata]|uniref:uncharacterized protein LOC141874742 n=1 Tax=Acropora palmata TaxID=6131 RepID=UPI003DA033A0
MPPKRRTLATNSRRSKRLRPSELPEVVPAQLATTTSAAPVADNDAGLIHLNVEALATTISVAVTEAVNAALTTHRSGNNVGVPSVSMPVVHPNDRAVEDEVTALTGISAEGHSLKCYYCNSSSCCDDCEKSHVNFGSSIDARCAKVY